MYFTIHNYTIMSSSLSFHGTQTQTFSASECGAYTIVMLERRNLIPTFMPERRNLTPVSYVRT